MLKTVCRLKGRLFLFHRWYASELLLAIGYSDPLKGKSRNRIDKKNRAP
jgi:hypothetical protein